MKKIYSEPEIEVITFSLGDILYTIPENSQDDDSEEFGWDDF